ncbi:MAG: Na+/H+ antiporter NhaC family protein [Oscillospiraceae bacterium]
MEAINVGFLSLLPPLIAIVLALATKEVISSLTIGILSGAFIYAINSPMTNGVIGTVFDGTFFALTNRFSVYIIIFLAILGALVYVITRAGGSKAYGEWATKKIKTRVGAQLSTCVLGMLIFIDDYFNCLTVGTVMNPVTDKYKISRVKLAYLIDSTAAPICIIAPISSWAASVIVYMEGTGMNGMTAFLQSIPYNLYAVLTIVMVIVMSLTNLEFGPMAKYEKLAREKGDLSIVNPTIHQEDEQGSSKGNVMDLVLPILSLVIFSIIAMLYVGGYFGGNMSIFEALGNTDAAVAITYGAFAALIFTFALFVPRKLLSFKEFMSGIGNGIGTMTQAFIILTLAWGMSTVCRDMLSTGEYVGNIVSTSNIAPSLIPAIIFIVAAFLSFSMGTSWGTFGILIPIIISICDAIAPELMIISLSATLAGSVFGDHCSPISDTTILSSTGANCDHIVHVTTQMYYSVLVAVCCVAGYLVAGFTRNIYLTLIISTVMLLIILKVLHMKSEKELSAEN